MAERSALLVAILMVVPALLVPLSSVPASAASGNPWFLSAVATEPQTIYGIAIGKTDPKLSGNQVVLTGGGGLVQEYDTSTFQKKTLFAALRTQESVAIGDVQSEYPGNEVVTAGQDGKVHVLHRESNGAWVAETAWTAPPPAEQTVLHSVTIGKFNASHNGKEIAAVGVNALLIILTEDKTQPNGWSSTVFKVQPPRVDSLVVIPASIIPGSPVNEILVGSASRDVFLVRWDVKNSTWNSTSIWNDVYPIFGLVYATSGMDGRTGPTIYTSSLSGRVAMLHFNGTAWSNETIYQEPLEKTIHRLVLADIDPRYSGPELIAGGVSSNLHLIHYSGGNFTDEDIKDPTGIDRLKNIWAIDVGEIDSTNQVNEVFAGGVGQDLIEVQYIEPSFGIVPLPSQQTVVSGHDAHFWLSVRSVGYFTGVVAMSADEGVTLSSSTAKPGDMLSVTIHTPATSTENVLKFNVSGKSLDLGTVKTATMTVDTLASTEQGFEISITPPVQYTTPGFTTYFIVRPTFLNGWSGILDYTMSTAMPLDYSHIGRASDDIKDPAIATLTPSALMGSGTFTVLITFHGRDASNTHFFQATAVAMVIVDASGAKDFTLTALPQEAAGVPNSTLRIDLTLNSPNDFTDNVLLAVNGIPNGCVGSFTSTIVPVPTKVSFTLDIGKTTAESYFVLSFMASGGGLEHSAPVIVHVLNAATAGDFGLEILPPTQNVAPGATAYFLLHMTGTLEPALKFVSDGPFQMTIQNAEAGNPDYRPIIVTVNSDAFPGVYKGTVTGTNGWEHNASLFIVISDDYKDIDLQLVPKDTLISPGQDWPVVHLNATVNRDLLLGKTLKYSVIGFGVPASFYTIYTYNFDKGLLLPMPDLQPATYLYLLEVYLPNSTYPKTLLGTVTMTSSVALLSMHVSHGQWNYREGATNSLQVIVVNNGLASVSDVSIEVLLDGKTIDTQVVGPISTRSQSKAVGFNWSAPAGDHNLTVIIFVNNVTGKARIMDKPYSEEFKIYAWGLEGPGIALLLILMVSILLAVTVSTREKEKKATGQQQNSPMVQEEE